MTDMEEQKMFEEAKAGDPRAQFELSQWARQMSILEPNEERWNRVAAKALIDSAQAGYEPAKKMVEQLMNGDESPAELPPDGEIVFPEPVECGEGDGYFAEEPTEYPAVSPSFYDQDQEEDYLDDEELDDMIDYEQGRSGRAASFGGVMQKVGAGAGRLGGGVKKLGAAVGGAVGKLKKKKTAPKAEPDAAAEDLEPESGTEYEAPIGRRAARARRSGLTGFIEDNWPIVKIVCIAVCAVLIVLIVLLLLPGKKTEEAVATPVPTSVPATPAPTAEPFPNEATLLEIRSTATLQYRPADSEYLTAAKTMTVTAEGAENLRQGPGAGDYPDVVMQLPQGTQVTVYAKHDTTDTDENGNLISWYLLNSGGTWGWMYGPSLS